MKYRNLTSEEIHHLEKQGCQADNWMNIEVIAAFKPDLIWHTIFEGKNSLGLYGHQSEDEVKQDVGIFHARVINCQIGDQVRIENVKRLENYDIGDYCILEDIGTLSVIS